MDRDKAKQASAILANTRHGTILTGAELTLMLDIFSNDARYPGVEIHSVKVAHAKKPFAQHKCFYALVDDGWTEWSYRKALGMRA